jgi:hypothetical protein
MFDSAVIVVVREYIIISLLIGLMGVCLVRLRKSLIAAILKHKDIGIEAKKDSNSDLVIE